MQFYKNTWTKRQTKKERNFLIKELQLSKKHKILDLACGFGRHSNELTKLGYKVTGIDINDCLLNEARSKAEYSHLKVKYFKSDINDFCQQSAFDRIILLYAYFDYATNNNILHNIFYTLKKDGIFCFDIPNKDYFLKHPKIVNATEGDFFFNESKKFEYLIHSYTKLTNYDNAFVEERTYEIVTTMYSLKEIEEILRKIGFRIVKVCSNWDSTILSNEYPKFVIITKKL